jgi:hypothetical protein
MGSIMTDLIKIIIQFIIAVYLISDYRLIANIIGWILMLPVILGLIILLFILTFNDNTKKQ